MTVGSRVLVVDDHPEMVKLLADQLRDEGLVVESATGGAEAIAVLRSSLVDLVLCDLRMEQVDGFDVLAESRLLDPPPPVLIMTAFGGVENAVEAMKRGAFHYLTKPFRLDEVLLLVRRALEDRRLRLENLTLRRAVAERSGLGNLIGRHPSMRALYELVERVARSPAPALIRGESGTGKELVARALHAEGPRRAGPFVAVNCTALPEALLESELFGHVKGSFTGASGPRRGLFLEADGGTLFLDEIGDMPPELQAKLLRVLETGELRPVGADAPQRVDVRVVAATHQDLEARMREGRFRQDLYFRLNVLPLRVPPLRERLDDLPVMVAHFVARARKRNPSAVLTQLAPDVVEALRQLAWPGNVRELENLIERLVVIGDRDCADLPLLQRILEPPLPLAGGPFNRQRMVTLRQLEGDYIEWVVAECGGNKTRAAELLGIDVSTVHRKGRDRREGSNPPD